jgi:hypothetical protein
VPEPFKPQPWVRVENPDAAAILANPDTLRFLTPFIGHERSVSEAARVLEISLNRLKYWIGRLVKLELIRVSSTVSGLKRYRAVADAFFVPFEATNAETAEGLFEQWNAPWQPVYYKNLVRVLAETAQDWGVRVQSGENGLLNVALANGPERNWDFFDADAPPVLDGWITDLRLEPEDAKSFMREMLHLYLRYAAKGGRQRYIARVSFAPLLDERELAFGDGNLE